MILCWILKEFSFFIESSNVVSSHKIFKDNSFLFTITFLFIFQANRQYLDLDSILDLDPNLDSTNVLDSVSIYFPLNSLTVIILLARLVFSPLSEIVWARNPQR